MNISAPANYVVRINGHLSEHYSASLVGMSIIGDSTTTIAGPVADQDQLHRVIARLGDAGTTLLEAHTDQEPGGIERAAESGPVVRSSGAQGMEFPSETTEPEVFVCMTSST